MADLHEIVINREYTKSYQVRYIANIRHRGLGTYRVIREKERYILQNKVNSQFIKWDDQWFKIVSKNKLQSDKEASIIVANERTHEAQTKNVEIENLLLASLSVKLSVNWELLKDRSKFNIDNPKNQLNTELSKLVPPSIPNEERIPDEPNKLMYRPKLSIFDKLFKSLGQKKIYVAEEDYNTAISNWEKKVKETKKFNIELNTEYELNVKTFEAKKETTIKKYDELEKEWKSEEENFYKNQEVSNLNIDKLKENYLQGDSEAVVQYCEHILNSSHYPETFPKDFELDYNQKTKLLIVEYVLPSPDDIPSLTEVKYIPIKKELKDVYFSEIQLSKIYDSVIYKVALRTLHELFESDGINAIDGIVFNGWVNATNKATGKMVNSCIVSVQANKSEFSEIELSNVEPKTCFKNFKGIGSSKLSGIVAIKPIVQINKNDKRFIQPQDVIDSIDDSYNLASMDWEDFEFLMREIFEKEFNTNGGEVKVTQASRDGGVDAIAFDPDPIRGGKIVIQAKRYTNTVSVSAVRDLYGTVMNEGANKGILVTTADYGPDSYEFAKNKPLTLMNGANLLYLMEKHGHKARINLAEAKKMQAEQK